MPAGVLMDRVEAGHAVAVLIFAADQGAGPLGATRITSMSWPRLDLAEVTVKPCADEQCVAGYRFGRDGVGVQRRLDHVGREHRDQSLP